MTYFCKQDVGNLENKLTGTLEEWVVARKNRMRKTSVYSVDTVLNLYFFITHAIKRKLVVIDDLKIGTAFRIEF